MTRLTNDLRLTDSTLHSTISSIFQILSYFLISIITILYLTPTFIIFAFILILLYITVLYCFREIIVDAREVDLIQRG